MSMNGVNKAIATVKKVAKQSTKVLAVALPAMTIVQNAAEAHAIDPTSAEKAFTRFVGRYTGVQRDGSFSKEEFMLGTGRLLIAGAAGWAIKQFA